MNSEVLVLLHLAFFSPYCFSQFCVTVALCSCDLELSMCLLNHRTLNQGSSQLLQAPPCSRPSQLQWGGAPWISSALFPCPHPLPCLHLQHLWEVPHLPRCQWLDRMAQTGKQLYALLLKKKLILPFFFFFKCSDILISFSELLSCFIPSKKFLKSTVISRDLAETLVAIFRLHIQNGLFYRKKIFCKYTNPSFNILICHCH